MNEAKLELIRYRISKSEQVLKEASILYENDMLFGAANRLYYSCYYSVLALLLSKDLHSKTHKGTLILFYQNFIETKILDKRWNTLVRRSFDLRSEGDYLDHVEIEKEEIKIMLNNVKDLIAVVKEALENK